MRAYANICQGSSPLDIRASPWRKSGMRRKFIVLSTATAMIHAQTPNVSGEWITRAGGRYTLTEKVGQRISIVPGSVSSPMGHGWLERGSDESLRGEVVIGDCWCQLSLVES